MAMDFGKLNFAVGFNRTSAFPLDANSYFEDYNAAVEAVAGAAEVGSADSAYYIGQIIIINDKSSTNNKGLGLYQITGTAGAGTLTKFGQATSADELGEKVSALGNQISIINNKLVAATQLKEGLMSADDKKKLDGIAEKAQVNTIEGIQLDGVDIAPGEGKKVNIVINETYLKKTDAANSYVAKENGKGLSTNDYDNNAKTVVESVAGINTRVTELEGKISGVTGAMHFKGVLTEKPSDLSSYAAGDVIVVDKKEYVCAENEEGTKEWHELGDEGSYLTKTEAETKYVKSESYSTDKAALEQNIQAAASAVAAEQTRATEAESALQTAIDGKASTGAVSAIETRVANIEGNYLTSSDKTALESAIGAKASQTDLNAATDKITTLETKVGNVAAEGKEATGLYKDIANEVAARQTLAKKVTNSEKNIETLQANVGTDGDGADAEGSLFARIKQLSSDLAGKIDGITVNGEAVTIENKIAQITLPDAFIIGLKEGEDDLVVTDGKLELAKVSTDKLVQGTKTLVLNGGNANK